MTTNRIKNKNKNRETKIAAISKNTKNKKQIKQTITSLENQQMIQQSIDLYKTSGLQNV